MKKRKMLMLALISNLLTSLILLCAVFAQHEEEGKLIVIANQQGLALAQDFLAFLKNEGIPVVAVTGSQFEKYGKEKYIFIFGGPKESEGIGDIVKQLLTEKEWEWAIQPGNEEMYIKRDIGTGGQFIFIFSGSDAQAVAKVRKRNEPKWMEYFANWFGIDISSKVHAY